MFDMLSNVFGNLLSKPATRLFPFVIRKNFKDTRGKLGEIKIEDCIFCSICEKKCPSLAITVDKASKTWTVNRYKCIVCGVCAEVCPKKCLHMEEDFLGAAFEKSVDAVKASSAEAKPIAEAKPATAANSDAEAKPEA